VGRIVSKRVVPVLAARVGMQHSVFFSGIEKFIGLRMLPVLVARVGMRLRAEPSIIPGLLQEVGGAWSPRPVLLARVGHHPSSRIIENPAPQLQNH